MPTSTTNLITLFLLSSHFLQVFGRNAALGLLAEEKIKATGTSHDSGRVGPGRRHHVSTNAGMVIFKINILFHSLRLLVELYR